VGCIKREARGRSFSHCQRCMSLYCSAICSKKDHESGSDFSKVCKSYKSNLQVEEITNRMKSSAKLLGQQPVIEASPDIPTSVYACLLFGQKEMTWLSDHDTYNKLIL
jgi:hypothetical protein